MVTRRRLFVFLCLGVVAVISLGSVAATPPSPGPGYDGPVPGPSSPPAPAPDPGPEPEPEPAPPNPTPAPGGGGMFPPGANSTWDGSFNGSANESAPGQGGGLFGFSPIDFAGSILEWTAKSALQSAADQLDWVAAIISGMPAPGQPTDPGTWTDPSDGLWPGVWTASLRVMPLAAVLLGLGGMVAFVRDDAYQRRQRLIRVGVATAMVLLTWFVAPLGLHIGSTVGQAFAPTGTEFLASPADFAKFGVGFLVAVALALISSAIIVIGLFVLAAQFFLAHAVVFFWPLAWALRCFDGFPKSIGDFVIYLWAGLIALNIGQAMLLRLVFELPWSAGGAVGGLMGFLGTAAGLAFALIWFPKAMLEQVTAGSAVGLGVSEGSKRAGRAATAARDKVGDVRTEYLGSSRGERSRDGADSQSASTRQTPALRRSGRSGSQARSDGGQARGGASASGNETPTNPYYRDSDWRTERTRRETDSIQRNAK